MSLYEGMFLLDSRQANRDWDGLMESLKAVLAKHGAEVVREVKWGERKLAYEIKGRRRGTYVLCYFNAPGEAITPIYREVELSDVIHRALILKVAKLPSDEEMFIPVEGSAWRKGARSPAASRKTAGGKDEKDTEEEEVDDEAPQDDDGSESADGVGEEPAAVAAATPTSADAEEETKSESVADSEDAGEAEAPKADAASSDA